MATRNEDLATEIETQLPDNNVNAITAAHLRTVVLDMLKGQSEYYNFKTIETVTSVPTPEPFTHTIIDISDDNKTYILPAPSVTQAGELQLAYGVSVGDTATYTLTITATGGVPLNAAGDTSIGLTIKDASILFVVNEAGDGYNITSNSGGGDMTKVIYDTANRQIDVYLAMGYDTVKHATNFSADPYKFNLINASSGLITSTIPNAIAGGKRRFPFTLIKDSHNLIVTTLGGVQTIGEKGETDQIITTNGATIILQERIDGTGYDIILDDRVYYRLVSISGDTDLTDGFESGGLIESSPAPAVTDTVTLKDPTDLPEGLCAIFRLAINNLGILHVIEPTTGFDEFIITPFKQFELFVSGGVYKVGQDSRASGSPLTGTDDKLALIAVAGGTTFDIGVGLYHVNNFQIGVARGISHKVLATDFQNVAPLGLGATSFTYVGLNVSKAIVQQTTPFTDVQLNSIAFIGNLTHINGAATFTSDATIEGNMGYRDSQQGSETNVRQGTRIIDNADVQFDQGDLDFTVSGGRYFRQGVSRIADPNDPNEVSVTSQLFSANAAQLHSKSGGGYFVEYPITGVAPNSWDEGNGTVGTVSPQKVTSKLIFGFPSTDGLVCVEQLGRVEYGSLEAAKSSPDPLDLTEYDFTLGAAFMGRLIVQQGVSNLQTAIAGGTTAVWLPNRKEANLYRPGINNNGTGGLGSGEVNTASNVNGAGVGVFKQKSGVDFEMKGVGSDDGSLTMTDKTADNTINVVLSAAKQAEIAAKLALSGGTLTGALVADEKVTMKKDIITPPVQITSADTITPNCANGVDQWINFDRASTHIAAMAGPIAGQWMEMLIIIDATGGRDMTLDSSYKTPNGAGITLNTDANARNLLSFRVQDDLAVSVDLIQEGLA